MGKTKYGNKPFWLNNLTFQRVEKLPKDSDPNKWSYWHSELEWKVYQELLKKHPSSFISRQVSTILLDSSVHFPFLTWKVDFKVSLPWLNGQTWDVFIEAKGKWLLANDNDRQAFTRTVQMFAYTNPSAYHRLLIVDDSPWRIAENIEVIGLKSLNSRIIHLFGSVQN